MHAGTHVQAHQSMPCPSIKHLQIRHVEAVVAYWAMCLLPDQRRYVDNISILPQGPLPHALLHLIQAFSEDAAISIVLGVGTTTWT